MFDGVLLFSQVRLHSQEHAGMFISGPDGSEMKGLVQVCLNRDAAMVVLWTNGSSRSPGGNNLGVQRHVASFSIHLASYRLIPKTYICAREKSNLYGNMFLLQSLSLSCYTPTPDATQYRTRGHGCLPQTLIATALPVDESRFSHKNTRPQTSTYPTPFLRT